MELTPWLAFFAASWAISISPGAGAVAAMSAGLNHGFARGYFMTFGLVLGIWTQVLVVGLGLGALIATSSLGFAVVKWLGVAYLVWLGIQQWRAPAVPMVAEAGEGGQAVAMHRRTLVLRGWMVNAVNPKGTVLCWPWCRSSWTSPRPVGAVHGDRRDARVHRPGGDGGLHGAGLQGAAAPEDTAADPRTEPGFRQPLRRRGWFVGAFQTLTSKDQ